MHNKTKKKVELQLNLNTPHPSIATIHLHSSDPPPALGRPAMYTLAGEASLDKSN